MGRTGYADLPLHGGRAPAWLFRRMTALSREIARAVVEDAGPAAFLRRLSDPFWFQSFGCVLGFDWHSSGLTTTVTGALKEGLRGREDETGLWVAGGKGRASRNTPAEIARACEKAGLDARVLEDASRTAAKVDNNALQDGYQLYHHAFVFASDGTWAVVQQGMSDTTRTARRYHWLSERVADFVVEPHAAVVAPAAAATLNLVASEAEQNRVRQAELARRPPAELLAELERLPSLTLPHRHEILAADIHPRLLERTLLIAYERQPEDFAALLRLPGVGAKTLRALSLLADVIYGAEPSFRDPALYAFAHGGKDGHPFPVDRATYDRSIAELKRAVDQSKLGRTERLSALRRLGAVERRAIG